LKVKTVSLNAYTFRKKYFRAACIRAKLARKQAEARETRDVDVANVAKSNIFFLSFSERKTLIYSLS